MRRLLNILLIAIIISIFALLFFIFHRFQVSAPVSSPVTVGFVGDLSLGRYITATARAKNDFSWSFQKISPWLLENDFTLANLESPIIAGCPAGPNDTYIFCGDPKFLPFLKSNRFVFNLNNNHILNYGTDGLTQTKSFLSTDLFYDNFYIKTVNGLKFGFLGYDFITYPNLDKSQILARVKDVKPQVDYLIVSIHWGNEYLSKPEQWRIDFAHQLIDAGVDVIHGQHPHVWQGLEIYKGKYIFYSLGNFIFDQNWSPETSHSQIARLTFTKTKITGYQLFPIDIKFSSQPGLSP